MHSCHCKAKGEREKGKLKDMPVDVYVWKNISMTPCHHVKESELNGDLRAISEAGEALLRQLQFRLHMQKYGK